MSAIDDKIQATKFILNTAKSFNEVRAAGLEAAAAASGGLTKVLENQIDSEASIQYMVKRGGFLDVMHFGLVFSGTADGSTNTVILVPGQYITSQATFLFIPLGPKESAGYKPLKKFSDHVRAALS